MKTIISILLFALAMGACTPAASIPVTAATDTVPAPLNTTAPSPAAALEPWSLVAIGDSISYNSPDDCRGCTGFVDRYAAAITAATGRPVATQNLSQHTGLQIDGLLNELQNDSLRLEALANADIIVVSIAHNDTAWNRNDDPCDGPSTDDIDWSKYNPTCAAEAAELLRPKFESVFGQVAALRAGQPTIFRAVNIYNDWIGLPNVDLSPEGTNATREVLDAYNAMLCKAAQENGFTCADIYHAFNGPDGRSPSPALIAQDTIHPSDKGNEVIAQVLADLGYDLTIAPATGTTAVQPSPAAPTAAVAVLQALPAALDADFQRLAMDHQFNGSVLISKNGEVLLSQGYGFADREHNIPNTIQTKFHLGGMTRQFTAMAIMLLQEQGKLRVQDSICATLTGCPEAWQPITIHQLLTVTSGIPDHSDDFISQDINSSEPLEKMIADAKTTPLDSTPGEAFTNANSDYVLLGKIIEAVSGQSYEAFLRQNIFDPLQMTNTGYDLNRDDLAIGYTDSTLATVADPFNRSVLFSSGGLYSSVEDLYRWDQALNTDKLVPLKVLDAIFTPYIASDREGYGYGYGWYVSVDKPLNAKQPGHGWGFDTTIRRYIDEKVTLIVLTNSEDTDMPSIATAIMEKIHGK